MHEIILRVQIAMFSVMLDKFAELERLLLAHNSQPTWGELENVTWGDLEGHKWSELRNVTNS
jgi:hypothetical protein